MDRSDRRRADELSTYWDGVVLGRAPTAPEPVGDVATLIEHLQALNDLSELDAARDRVWRDMQQYRRWKEPPVSPTSFALTTAAGPPLAAPHAWPLQRTVAHAATALLLVATLLLAYVSIFRQNDMRPVISPAIGTPTPPATPEAGWWTYRGDAARTGVSASPGPAGSPLQLWRVVVGDRVNSSPAIVDGAVYVGSDDDYLYAFDATTGAERWRFNAESPVSSTPAVSSGVLYTGAESGVLFAIDAESGQERWRFPAARAQSSPAVVAGVVSTGGEDGNLYALDANTGAEIWRLALGGVPSRSPAVGDGLVVVGADDARVHAIDLATGEERWRFSIADDSTIGTPVIANGVVYEAAFDGSSPRLYALDAATGNELWQFGTETNASIWVPAATATTLYAGSNDGNIYALDATTGQERWRFATGDIVPASAALAGNVLFAASYDRNMYALDAASGTELWRFPLDHEVDQGPSIVDGVAYLGTKSGSIYAIGGTESATTAASSSMTAPAAVAGTPSDTTAAPLELLWQSTGGPEPLFSAGSVAIDPAGNLYVLDAGNDRFQIFSPDGAFLETWDGTSGGGQPFDLWSAVMDGSDGNIAFDTTGNIFVVESGARRVQAFDANRQFVTSWGGQGTGDGQFATPQGIAVGPEGDVYVSDMTRDDIQRFAPDGTYLATIGEPGNGDGQLSEVGHLTVDSQGVIIAADYGNNRIARFAADGTPLAAWSSRSSGTNQPMAPMDVAVDAAGNVYVADLDNTRIQVFNANGEHIAVWDAGLTPEGNDNYPYALTVDTQGHVYVVGTSADFETEASVQKFLLPAS